jgi:hypothetical protein
MRLMRVRIFFFMCVSPLFSRKKCKNQDGCEGGRGLEYQVQRIEYAGEHTEFLKEFDQQDYEGGQAECREVGAAKILQDCMHGECERVGPADIGTEVVYKVQNAVGCLGWCIRISYTEGTGHKERYIGFRAQQYIYGQTCKKRQQDVQDVDMLRKTTGAVAVHDVLLSPLSFNGMSSESLMIDNSGKRVPFEGLQGEGGPIQGPL